MEKIIESGDNKKYKLAKKLKQKKYRERFNAYLIEGVNLLEEAIKVNAPIEVIFICEGNEYKIDNENAFYLNKKLFKELSETENSQGVIAVINKTIWDIKDLSLKEYDNVVILDSLQDPGNIGTILRTAVAADYRALFLLKGTGDIYSPKTVRATAGLINKIPIIEIDKEDDFIEYIKKIGIRLVATTPRGIEPYYERDLSKGVGLIVGNEGNGIRESLLKKADLYITIPMGNSVESLNAAVAASIIMYEAVRKNKRN